MLPGSWRRRRGGPGGWGGHPKQRLESARFWHLLALAGCLGSRLGSARHESRSAFSLYDDETMARAKQVLAQAETSPCSKARDWTAANYWLLRRKILVHALHRHAPGHLSEAAKSRPTMADIPEQSKRPPQESMGFPCGGLFNDSESLPLMGGSPKDRTLLGLGAWQHWGMRLCRLSERECESSFNSDCWLYRGLGSIAEYINLHIENVPCHYRKEMHPIGVIRGATELP